MNGRFPPLKWCPTCRETKIEQHKNQCDWCKGHKKPRPHARARRLQRLINDKDDR